MAEFALFLVGIGLTVGPMIPGMFGDKHAVAGPNFDINYIRIGVGINDTDAGQYTLNGTLPAVTFYNANGETISSVIGTDHLDTKPEDDPDKTLGFDRSGQFTELKAHGREEIEYVRISAGPNHPICISWVALTAASTDWRGWNGGFGMRCGLPHYPSIGKIPNTDYRPPCVWLSAQDDDPLPQGLSWRVNDFMPPEGAPQTQTANLKALAESWDKDPDLLCKAPGRMQFWDLSLVNQCVPFFPKPLEFVDGKDKDKNILMNGHRQRCNTNYVHNKDVVVYDMDGKVLDTDSEFLNTQQDPKALEELNKQVDEMKDNGAIFSSSLQLGPLAPAPPSKQKRGTVQKRSKVGKRSSDGMEFIRAASDEHEKCLRELVVHSQPDVLVRGLCDSPSSWGPDMASDAERLYCDMCTHEIHKYCDTDDELDCWNPAKQELRVPNSGKRSDGSLYPLAKRYETVHQWD